MAGYYYIDGEQNPLSTCPKCGHDLTTGKDGRSPGVFIALVVAGNEMRSPSVLNDRGDLMDTTDDVVAKGFHSATLCGGCEELLINMEGVQEGRDDDEEDDETTDYDAVQKNADGLF